MRRFAIILACCAGFYLLLFSLFLSLTNVGELRTHFPRVVYEPESETAAVEIVRQRPTGWASLREISPIAAAAVVISEDSAFWQHNGFDWDQLRDAMETNLRKGRFARGGSTITQQVIKNVYLTKEKTLLRKLKEAVLTMRIERLVGKKRILEIYLNVAELGPGIYGIGPASRYYFQKRPSELNAREGAFLAMLLPSPKRYGVSFRKKALTPFARGAIRGILAKLEASGRLTEEQRILENSRPLPFEATQLPAETTAPPDEEETPEDSPAPEVGQPAPVAVSRARIHLQTG
jgi:monofunctional biosynthetic peptidoglycan transglycosylase